MAELPLLPYAPIVEGNLAPTAQMQQWWQTAIQAIQQNIADIQAALDQAIAALNQAIDAQNAAIAAQTAAIAAQSTADGAATDAASAQAAADAAQATADSKLSQTTADARYVRQGQTAAWSAPTGTSSRASLASYAAPTISASYTQSEVQAIANAAQAGSRALVALIADLKANGALT